MLDFSREKAEIFVFGNSGFRFSGESCCEGWSMEDIESQTEYRSRMYVEELKILLQCNYNAHDNNCNFPKEVR